MLSLEDTGASSEALLQYYQRRKAGQTRWISELTDAISTVSKSEAYQSNGKISTDITLTQIPFFDVELVGVPALGYLAKSCYTDNSVFKYMMDDSSEGDTKFLLCGGKGGVGKTTTSSSLAVAMAGAGHRVALVSTDPAHSLGDALDMDLKSGNMVEVPLVGVPPSEGSLSAMEVDPAAAVGRFRELVNGLVGSTLSEGVGSALGDLGEVFDTLPPGTDEVVALAKVVSLLKGGDYDRVVLDTAPTGHTLRMLSTPAFVAELIDRVLEISRKVNSNPAVKMLLSGAAAGGSGGGDGLEEAQTATRAALTSFQMQMYDLEDLLSDADRTEFLIVTVPTELAVRESVRLLNDLTFDAPDMPIKVRNVVVNQVLLGNDDDEGNNDNAESFLKRVESGQAASIRELRAVVTGDMEPSPTLTTVPYLDTEPRGVFGLKALSYELLGGDEE